jgi:hypothetical protein
LEQLLTGMAADLRSLRATMELMAEQMSRLVALGGQQIEAIAQLAPAMVQSTDRISGELKDIVSAVRLGSGPSGEGVQQPAPLIEPRLEQDQEARAEPGSAQAVQPAAPIKRTRGSRTNESTGRRSAADHVAVKSIADTKRPDRFYTTIRLPRELWDKSGFGPDDRIQLDCKRKTVSISRVPDGGVKPKTIGDAVVVLQSWRLGDLNFDPTKITSENGVLRLTLP